MLVLDVNSDKGGDIREERCHEVFVGLCSVRVRRIGNSGVKCSRLELSREG